MNLSKRTAVIGTGAGISAILLMVGGINNMNLSSKGKRTLASIPSESLGIAKKEFGTPPTAFDYFLAETLKGRYRSHIVENRIEFTLSPMKEPIACQPELITQKVQNLLPYHVSQIVEMDELQYGFADDEGEIQSQALLSCDHQKGLRSASLLLFRSKSSP